MIDEKIRLPDVQALPDSRAIAIDSVGIKGLKFPVTVRTLDGCAQPSVAEFDMYVQLAAEVKGTHMSRFIELLEGSHAPLDYSAAEKLLRDMVNKLGAETGEMEIRFPSSSANMRLCRAYRVRLIISSKSTRAPIPWTAFV